MKEPKYKVGDEVWFTNYRRVSNPDDVYIRKGTIQETNRFFAYGETGYVISGTVMVVPENCVNETLDGLVLQYKEECQAIIRRMEEIVKQIDKEGQA